MDKSVCYIEALILQLSVLYRYFYVDLTYVLPEHVRVSIVRTPPFFKRGIGFPENGLKGGSKILVFKGGYPRGGGQK